MLERGEPLTPFIDHVPAGIRAIEAQIDQLFKSNPLIQLPFTKAAWHLLAFTERKSIVAANMKSLNPSLYGDSILIDNFYDQTEDPLRWLWNSCSKGGAIPDLFDEKLNSSLQELAGLGLQYAPFAVVLTLASQGLVDLELEGTTIKSKPHSLTSMRHEAYGRLIQESEPVQSYPHNDEFKTKIESSLRYSGDTFKLQLGRRLFEEASEVLSPMFDDIYRLPDDWQFARFSLIEFRRMASYLMVHAWLQYLANGLAFQHNSRKVCINCALIVLPEEKLIWNLMRYADARIDAARAFVDLLAYGNMGIQKPSIKQQPLVKVNHEDILIVPSLMMSNSLERNFTVLLNQIPSEQKIYSALVQKKEAILREKIQSRLEMPDLRFEHGKFPSKMRLPDVDLAVISDKEKAVLIVEIKWFISPSGPREMIDRTKEIQKGIDQVTKLENMFRQSPSLFYDKFNVDSTYDFLFCVFSENFTGMDQIHRPETPVVNAHHFIKMLNHRGSLREILIWLKQQDYLPVEGVHFKTEEMVIPVGDYTFLWQGVKPLIQHDYL